jgi:hypothetical protein
MKHLLKECGPMTTLKLWQKVSPLFDTIDEFVVSLSAMSHKGDITTEGDLVFVTPKE